MTDNKRPPRAYRSFIDTCPRLGEAWERAREQESEEGGLAPDGDLSPGS